jgi:serine/threonine protein phosphatase PrpC
MSGIIANYVIGNINGSVKGLLKNQDLIYFGKTPSYHWSVVLDGHGTNRFQTEVLNCLDWDKIMSTDDPSETAVDLVKRKNGTYGINSGCTMSLIKMFSDRIETYNIGDSTTAIYKNGELVYKNCPHNSNNQSEHDRFTNAGIDVTFKNTSNLIPHCISANELVGKYNKYCRFNSHTNLALTQALGHNDVTGYHAEFHVEYYEQTDNIRCVSGSDGFFDMFLFDGENEEDIKQDKIDILTKNSSELLEKMEKRWKQPWNYYPDISNRDTKISQIKYPPESYDDISIIIWDNC